MSGPARFVRRPRTTRTALLTAVLLGLAALGGCSDEAAPERPVDVVEQTIADFDGTTLALERASFCSRYADEAVTDAVTELATTRHHGNGEAVPGIGDLGHEYGCSFVGTDGSVAEAWVFVPPVTPGQARSLVRDARSRQGCQAVSGHRFGSPALGLLCRGPKVASASYQGLFGDAWLTCEVRTPKVRAPKELLARAGDWCVQTAAAAAG